MGWTGNIARMGRRGLHIEFSTDLASSDFWLFPMLRIGLRGRRFAAVEDIKENADARLRAIKKEDFHQCYNNWIDRWNKCVCADRKYFEGDYVCKSWFSHNEDLQPHFGNFMNAPYIYIIFHWHRPLFILVFIPMDHEEKRNHSLISDLSIELISVNEYWLSVGVAV
jgi:hypothetical protein